MYNPHKPYIKQQWKEPAEQKPSGLKCPRCTTFIPFDMYDLLSMQAISCPNCMLRLSINRENSMQALDAIKTLKDSREKR